MERASRAWTWALFFFVLFSVHGTFGCLDGERSALLHIKEYINHPNGTSLPSWEGETDCCSWKHVKCNSTLGRVMELYLNDTRQFFLEIGFIDGKALERWSNYGKVEILKLHGNKLKNSDRVLPYIGADSSLKALDLSYNDMEFSHTGFERLSKLRKLEMLNLRENRLDVSVMQYLGAVKSLKYLSIGYNDFHPPRPDGMISVIQYLAAIKSLEFLHIGLESYDIPPLDSINTVIQYLANIKSLKYLSIGVFEDDFLDPLDTVELPTLNELEVFYLSTKGWWTTETSYGPIPTSIEALISLKELYLSENNLNDSQSIHGLCKLKNLEVLDLHYNNFDGEIPPCLTNLTNLRVLDLSGNQFSGRIPTSLFASLTLLELLSLSSNNFSGSFQLSSLANLSKLKGIELMHNHNVLEVETESALWVPRFQLEVFQMENCIFNRATGEIPKFLYSQYDLRHLQLPNNNLNGTLPIWLLENNTQLEMFNVRNNSLMGSFHLPYRISNTSMLLLDISNNKIHGELPNNISAVFPNLKLLNLSRNALSGIIPPSFGDLRRLLILDVSHNKLEGEILEHLFAGCVSLEMLKLSNNSFRGQMFSANSNMSSLLYLYLDNNQFTTMFSTGLLQSSLLRILDIANNNLSGELPTQIGELSKLSSLNLHGNDFEGLVPNKFCNLSELWFLDLSENKLYGQIPFCFLKLPSIKFIHLEKNEFSGNLSSALSKRSHLVTLDVRFNRISGEVPNWIGGLLNLRALLLKGNHFQGSIPLELCKLDKLSMLDLSSNNISGSIPSCFNSTAFGGKVVIDDAFGPDSYYLDNPGRDLSTYSITTQVAISSYVGLGYEASDGQPVVEFITKSRSDSYKGSILYYMSGIDLSSNQLSGEIPAQIGNLSGLHALNLSHNQFTGPIPRTFSNLRETESLDLSYNRLNGEIPSRLTELNFLSCFTVAHNNLSGKIPNMVSQFATFTESSYEGNPLLCGLPLNKNCTSLTHTIEDLEEEDDGDDDLVIFYASFAGSYFVSFLSTIAIFNYNSQRNAACFLCNIDSWCVFILYKICKLFYHK